MVSFTFRALVLWSLCLQAASGATVHCITYGNEHGLPSNLTKAIIQDATGFIWIGSDAGLVRFDGKNFVTFTSQLPSRFVKQLFIDRTNRLLVVTDLGISAVGGKGLMPHFSTVLSAAPRHTDTSLFYPKGLFESRNGTLWISEPDAVVKYSHGKLRRYPFLEKYRADSYARSFQLIENTEGDLFVLSERGYVFRYNAPADAFELLANEERVRPFLIDAVLRESNGTIVIGGSTGVYELHAHVRTRSFSLKQRVALPNVSSLIQWKDGALFAGTWLSGVYRIEKRNGYSAEPLSSLPYRVINDLAIGRDGEVWVSSDEGIGLVSESYFAPVPLKLTNYYIEAITMSVDGTILATDGKSVFQFDEKGERPGNVLFTGKESLILSLATDGTTVWIGYRDGFLTELRNGKAVKHILPAGGNRLLKFLFIDRRKNLWICQDGLQGLYRFSPDRRIKLYGPSEGISSPITVVREMRDGKILCGGAGAQSYLYEYDDARDLFVNRSVPIDGVSGTLSTDDLAADAGDRIWLGTSSGLLVYHNGRVTRPEGFELFNEEPIKSIAIDSMNNVWLGTDRGVLRYANRQVSRFDGRDGLTSMTMAYRTCVVDRKQKIWLGTAHGISRWNRASVQASATPTPVFIALDVNGSAISDSAASEYDYQSYFSAVAASLSYPADKILYRYRVKEQSETWSEPSYSSAVVIPQFREGRHTVEISAVQPGYLWSAPVSFTFTVAPPFYRTWWMYSLYAVFICIGIAAALKFRVGSIERRRLRSALAESENNLRALFNTMHDIYFQFDPAGRITEIAPSIVTHSGYTREELIGTNSGHIYAQPNDRKRLMMKLVRNGEIIDQEILLKRKNGETVWVSLNAQLVKNGKGKVLCTRGVMREITSRKQLEDDLRENLKRERELSELKSRFVSMVSHEFRTPLATIFSSTEMLERYNMSWDDAKAEKARAHYRRILNSIRRMTVLLDDVLIIGKAEAGKLECVRKPLRLVPFCQQIVDELQSTLEPKHEGIRFEPGFAAREAMFDEKLLRQIITNLLSNAIKYSPQGGAVTFTLDERDDQAVFSVRDQGIGIPSIDLAHLFESFHPAKNVGTIQGTGLGLTIVKRCVELHGGTITVQSVENAGTTFIVSLPMLRKL